MTTWTPPASTSLSSNDIDRVVAGLRDPSTREEASAYLEEVTDPGLLYVIACRFGDRRRDRPNPHAAAAGLRTFIRNRI